MKKHKQYIKWLLIYTLIGVILFESVAIDKIMMSLCLSALALYYTDKFLIGMPFHHKYKFSFLKSGKYLIFLLKEIYIAGFKTLWMTLKGDIHMGIVEFETDLEDSFKRAILANSITLTPGTITIDMDYKTIKVLWIDAKPNEDLDPKTQIASKIEEKLVT
ncbi:MAG: Na+/H+ antiporter subunit E [Clostridia bacterium]|nr:Na+/H+ antiporter subunit E [Clostridia bacterium]